MSGACDVSPEGARRSRDRRGWSVRVATVSGDERSEALAFDFVGRKHFMIRPAIRTA
ncbi:MAG: hypothetical protein MK110_16175 [Fuerstiella sp.]|nr:hypothetical protein [Fuerstiella sp.]